MLQSTEHWSSARSIHISARSWHWEALEWQLPALEAHTPYSRTLQSWPTHSYCIHQVCLPQFPHRYFPYQFFVKWNTWKLLIEDGHLPASPLCDSASLVHSSKHHIWVKCRTRSKSSASYLRFWYWLLWLFWAELFHCIVIFLLIFWHQHLEWTSSL